MTVGIAVGQANGMLDALCRNVSYTNAAVWIKWHVGDPGAAGTANAAGETTRQQATFGTGAGSGTIANTVALLWTAVSTSEDYTHFSAWTASTAGTFLFSGTVTANAVGAGDDLSVAIGALTVPFTIAA
jgi:uncharacterized membrane protein YgdD (TMEM256/DUF423 family)